MICMVYLVAGSSHRPIHDLSNTISAITEDNLQERISYENGNDEVGALGHSFNSMLDRLDMLASILRELRQVLEDKHIETEFICKLKSIYGNQVLLYRACFNLAENAVKYNKDGGRISVKTEREAGPS